MGNNRSTGIPSKEVIIIFKVDDSELKRSFDTLELLKKKIDPELINVFNKLNNQFKNITTQINILTNRVGVLSNVLSQLDKGVKFDKIETQIKKLVNEINTLKSNLSGSVNINVNTNIDDVKTKINNLNKDLTIDVKINVDDSELKNKIKQKPVEVDVKTKTTNIIQETTQQSAQQSSVKPSSLKGVTSELTGLSSVLSNLPVLLAGVFTLDKLKDFSVESFKAATNLENIFLRLKVSLGSSSQAQETLTSLKDLSVQTGLSVSELGDSFLKLTNRGLTPTNEELVKLGDIAASQGKSLDQLVEAILDATTGENERLKEFGIQAEKNGDKVKFSFKGITKEVQNTPKAINEAILAFSTLEGVSGGLVESQAGLQGNVNKLNNAYENLKSTFGLLIATPVINFMTEVTNATQSLTSSLSNFLGTGNPLAVFNKDAENLQKTNSRIQVLTETLLNSNVDANTYSKSLTELVSIFDKYGLQLPDAIKKTKDFSELQKVGITDLTSSVGTLQETLNRQANSFTSKDKFNEAKKNYNDLSNEIVKINQGLGNESESLEEKITSSLTGYKTLSDNIIPILNKQGVSTDEIIKKFEEYGIAIDPLEAKLSNNLTIPINDFNKSTKVLIDLQSKANNNLNKSETSYKNASKGVDFFTNSTRELIKELNEGKVVGKDFILQLEKLGIESKLRQEGGQGVLRQQSQNFKDLSNALSLINKEQEKIKKTGDKTDKQKEDETKELKKQQEEYSDIIDKQKKLNDERLREIDTQDKAIGDFNNRTIRRLELENDIQKIATNTESILTNLEGKRLSLILQYKDELKDLDLQQNSFLTEANKLTGNDKQLQVDKVKSAFVKARKELDERNSLNISKVITESFENISTKNTNVFVKGVENINEKFLSDLQKELNKTEPTQTESFLQALNINTQNVLKTESNVITKNTKELELFRQTITDNLSGILNDVVSRVTDEGAPQELQLQFKDFDESFKKITQLFSDVKINNVFDETQINTIKNTISEINKRVDEIKEIRVGVEIASTSGGPSVDTSFNIVKSQERIALLNKEIKEILNDNVKVISNVFSFIDKGDDSIKKNMEQIQKLTKESTNIAKVIDELKTKPVTIETDKILNELQIELKDINREIEKNINVLSVSLKDIGSKTTDGVKDNISNFLLVFKDYDKQLDDFVKKQIEDTKNKENNIIESLDNNEKKIKINIDKTIELINKLKLSFDDLSSVTFPILSGSFFEQLKKDGVELIGTTADVKTSLQSLVDTSGGIENLVIKLSNLAKTGVDLSKIVEVGDLKGKSEIIKESLSNLKDFSFSFKSDIDSNFDVSESLDKVNLSLETTDGKVESFSVSVDELNKLFNINAKTTEESKKGITGFLETLKEIQGVRTLLPSGVSDIKNIRSVQTIFESILKSRTELSEGLTNSIKELFGSQIQNEIQKATEKEKLRLEDIQSFKKVFDNVSSFISGAKIMDDSLKQLSNTASKIGDFIVKAFSDDNLKTYQKGLIGVSIGLDAVSDILSLVQKSQNESFNKEIKNIDKTIEKQKQLRTESSGRIETLTQELESLNDLEEERRLITQENINQLELLKSGADQSEVARIEAKVSRLIELDNNLDSSRKSNIETQLSSEKKKNDELVKRETELEKHKESIRKKNFEQNKALQIAQVVVYGATSIIRQYAELPLPAAIVSSILIAALTAAQIAIIAGQEYVPAEFKTGTDYVDGPGGKHNVDTIPALLSKGEAVIPFQQNMKHRDLVRDIINDNVKGDITDIEYFKNSVNNINMLEQKDNLLSNNDMNDMLKTHIYNSINNGSTYSNPVFNNKNDIIVNTDEISNVIKQMNSKPTSMVNIDEKGFLVYLEKQNKINKINAKRYNWKG